MAKYNYAFKNLKDNMARAVARDASVSFKYAVEASKFFKGKTTKTVKAYLEKVIEKKLAIPFTRFTDGVGHRKGKGITSGRYPLKLSQTLLKLLKNVESNASLKGLGENLKIVSLIANKASTPMHYGRHPRREMKRTHIEIVVQEVSDSNKKNNSQKKSAEKITSKKGTKK